MLAIFLVIFGYGHLLVFGAVFVGPLCVLLLFRWYVLCHFLPQDVLLFVMLQLCYLCNFCVTFSKSGEFYLPKVGYSKRLQLAPLTE